MPVQEYWTADLQSADSDASSKLKSAVKHFRLSPLDHFATGVDSDGISGFYETIVARFNSARLVKNDRTKTMKLLLTVCLWIAAALGCNAEGDFNHDGDGVGHAEYFHQSLHHDGRPELYLVCYYAVRVQPHGIEHLAAQGWEEIVVSCTVVDSIRGPKKVGDRFEYVRYRDGKAGNTKDLLGMLTYVFFTQAAGGRFVDPQDPTSEWLFSEELRRVAESHRNPRPEAEPGAAQPAAAAESKPEGDAKPEPEVLPR